jgi:hypothetical protein
MQIASGFPPPARSGRRITSTFNWLGRFVTACPPAVHGVFLLGVSFVVGCVAVYLGNFSDEGDTLAVALALSHGSVLFRDLFTHHFPFSYYWVSAVFLLLGPSILAARISLLFLQLVVFAVLMRALRAPVPVGLAAVAWSATRHLFIAHMVTYYAFDALALALVFGTALALLLERARPENWLWLTIGIFSAMCVLNDPLTAVPIGTSFIFLLLNRKWWRGVILIAGIVLAALAVYLTYLYFSRTLLDFYQDVVLFNSQVYSRYYYFDLHVYASLMSDAVAWGLNIFRPSGWLGFDAYSPYFHYIALTQWLFGGFLQRLALLAACGSLLWRQKWRAAWFIYLFSATLLPRADVYPREASFMLVSYLAAASLLLPAWPVLWHWFTWPPGHWRSVRAWLAASALALAIWPTLLGLALLARHVGSFSYATNFQVYEDLAAHLNALDCGRNAELGYYPGDPIVYFFTDRLPVSKYEYLWPWVADIALPDVISQLGQHEAIVHFEAVPSIWGIPTAVYLADLKLYVTTHYVHLGDDYISPQLAAHCPLVTH